MGELLWIYPLIGVVLHLCWTAKHGRGMRGGEWVVTGLFWPLTVISLLLDPADRSAAVPLSMKWRGDRGEAEEGKEEVGEG